MPFERLLTELVREVPGAMGAILADWEGEAVAQAALMDDYELKIIGAHQGILLNHFRDAIRRLGLDELEELAVMTEDLRIFVVPVTMDYYVALLLRREAPWGPARFACGICKERLKKEIG